MADDLDKLFPGRAEPTPTPGILQGARDWMSAIGRLHEATVAENDAVRNSQSSRIILREAYQRRIDAIHAATGATLENPMNVSDEPTGVGGQMFGPEGLSPSRAAVRWGLQAADLARKFPEQRSIILGNRTVDEDAQDLARQKVRDLDAATADPRLGPVGRTLAGFSGGAEGMARDPMQAPLLMAGGGFLGPGKTLIGAIARTMVSEAATNAAMEAAVQPFEQSRRQQLGLEHGTGLAAENVASAGAVGAGFGVVGSVVGAGTKAAWKALSGARSVADLEGVAKATGVPLDDAQRAVAAQAEAADAADAVAWGTPPAGLTPDEVSALKAQSIGAAETPNAVPRAVGPVPKPERPPEVARVIDESRPGAAGEIGGKPVTYGNFQPRDIGTDAGAFQYKDGGDAAGVTDRLAGVTRWDPMASGKVFIFERADGAKVIADGHQRLGLAKRLEAGGQDVKLDGYLFREADGWTVQDVRALAAKKNLQEGSGSVMDTARILRDRPDILDASLPTTGPMIRKAQGLARLSDDAWRMTVNGLVPDNQAALVGEMEANPARHAAILADLKRYAPETEREARLLVQEIQTSGVSHETQTDMFGAFDVSKTLIGERVKVLDQAMQNLRTDKRVFDALSRNAEMIEKAGNSLDRTGNRVRAVTADFVATLIEKMARSRGEMSDLLTDAARSVAEGKTISVSSRRFLDDVRDLIERRGFGRLMQEADAPPPVLRPTVAPEPGSAEALRMAEAAAPIARPDAAQRGVAWTSDEASFFADRPARSIDELYAIVPRHQAALVAAGREIARDVGVEFKEAKLKDRATAEGKMARKGYKTTANLTDIVRSGFIVDTPAKAQAVVDALADRFTVLDEGWKRTAVGYIDRKVLVRFDDGTIGEVQLWEPHMVAAKEAGGHALFEQRRVATNALEKQRLDAEMTKLYSAATARSRSASDWSNLEMSRGPKVGSNRRRQSASSMTPAVSETSLSSTSTQSSPGSSTANAEYSGRNSTAGRLSQSQNVGDMGNTSIGDIGTGPDNSRKSSGDDQVSLWDVLPDGTTADGASRHVTAADMIDDADRTQHLANASELCTRA